MRRLKVYLQMRVGRSADANPQLAARLYSELLRVLDGADSRGGKRRRAGVCGAVGEPSWRRRCGSSRKFMRRRDLAGRRATRCACEDCWSRCARSFRVALNSFRAVGRRVETASHCCVYYRRVLHSECENTAVNPAHLQHMTKVGFISLGCPKNLVDSEVMMGILAREGYELTPRADEAEVLVVNTCSFIEPAQKESVDAILEMAEHKKFGAAKKLIVAGCLVERYRDQILEQVPEVDAVVGTGEVERILEAVEGDLRMLPAEPPAFLYHDLTPRVVTTPRHAAYIKIAEGCDHPCTFCIIPQLRGKFRSRRFESVVREAENLAAGGAREITLIGQDTTSYGEDLGLRDGLAQLLERLAQVEELMWVRFLYAYPNRVTQKLLDTMAAHPRLAKYMDMPLQHASRNVLARMKRGSHGDAFLKLLERIRATIPGVSLRTSFIVGISRRDGKRISRSCAILCARRSWIGWACSSIRTWTTRGAFGLEEKVDRGNDCAIGATG